MRMRWKLALLLLIVVASAAPSLAQPRGSAPAGQPAVAYAADGILYLATESGQVVQTIEAELPIGDFAISPDLKTVVFAPPHPGEIGGPLFTLDVASGSVAPVMPDPYFNDGSIDELVEFYSDPEFSADGRKVVFAVHAYGEGSDVQLSGPLAVLDLTTGEVSIVGSTVGSDSFPFGNMRNPHWSPDGRQILGNMEGHSFLSDAEGQSLNEILIPSSELSQSSQSYGMYAIGWLGSGCVLYQAGEEPDRDPARIFRTRTQETMLAAEILRLPGEELRGLREFSGRLRMFQDYEGYRIEGPAGNWTIRGDAETTFASLLPQRGAADQIPADCR